MRTSVLFGLGLAVVVGVYAALSAVVDWAPAREVADEDGSGGGPNRFVVVFKDADHAPPPAARRATTKSTRESPVVHRGTGRPAPARPHGTPWEALPRDEQPPSDVTRADLDAQLDRVAIELRHIIATLENRPDPAARRVLERAAALETERARLADGDLSPGSVDELRRRVTALQAQAEAGLR